MSSLGEIGNFINYVKHETDKPVKTSRMLVYQKVFKELKPEERKLLLKIIHNPEKEASKPKAKDLALRIKNLTEEVQSPDFKSDRKIGTWHSFCRIMENIFFDRVGSNKLIRSISDSEAHDGKVKKYEAPEAIPFKKGETQQVIPRNKNKRLGQGNIAGAVYEHGENSKLAVKKLEGVEGVGMVVFGLQIPEARQGNEYKIGATLHHPNLARTYQLYTEQYAPDEKGVQKRDKNFIVMDKVEGKNMSHYYTRNKIISPAQAAKLLNQAKDCCGYLFDQNIVWKDVNDGNIFIEKKTDNLKLIDFGMWRNEEDPKAKGFDLLFGAMELAGWVVRNTPQGKKENEKRAEFLTKVLFPESFFNEKLDYMPISSFSSNIYEREEWVQNLQQKMKTMSDEEIKAFVTSYFDHVIEELNNLSQDLG